MTALILGLVALLVCFIGIAIEHAGLTYTAAFLGAFTILVGIIGLRREHAP